VDLAGHALPVILTAAIAAIVIVATIVIVIVATVVIVIVATVVIVIVAAMGLAPDFHVPAVVAAYIDLDLRGRDARIRTWAEVRLGAGRQFAGN
jgi:hypothetical protein